VHRWKTSKSCYSFQSHHSFGCSPDELREITSELIDAAAYHNNAESSGLRPTRGQRHILGRLWLAGLVEQKGEGLDAPWFFTAEGISQVKRFSTASNPEPVFEVRRNLPLTDGSTYELLVKLEADKWKWSAWVPPASRSKRSRMSFEPYQQGSAKIWFSGKTICKHYVAALLNSEDLFAKGLQRIPHGMPEANYRRILRGDFSLQTLPLQDIPDGMPMDIEDIAPPRIPATAPEVPPGPAAEAASEDDHNNEDEDMLEGACASSSVITRGFASKFSAEQISGRPPFSRRSPPLDPTLLSPPGLLCVFYRKITASAKLVDVSSRHTTYELLLLFYSLVAKLSMAILWLGVAKGFLISVLIWF
jgi:hypothetical protein